MRAHARIAAVVAGGLTLLAPLAAAQSDRKPVSARDPVGDAARNAPDLTRVQLGLASDGRLRAAITLSRGLDPKTLLADSGPPGSICLRVWTLTLPGTVPPDFLVCVTATSKGRLRGTISAERVNAQPRRVGPASVSRSSSRTLVVKFARSRVGSPKTTVRFAAEATRQGCTRISCVDTAPNAPATLTFNLRSG